MPDQPDLPTIPPATPPVATLVTTKGIVCTISVIDGELALTVGGARPVVFDRFQTLAALAALGSLATAQVTP